MAPIPCMEIEQTKFSYKIALITDTCPRELRSIVTPPLPGAEAATYHCMRIINDIKEL